MAKKVVSSVTSWYCVKKALGGTLFLLGFLSFFIVGTVQAATDEGEELLVSFNLEKMPMKDVINMITLQTGYTVKLEDELAGLPVSGEFTSVEVTSFFNQALRKKNPFITISTKEKVITVRTNTTGKAFSTAVNVPENEAGTIDTSLGDKPESDKYGSIHELGPGRPPKVSNDKSHIIDSQTGKPWKDVEELLK